jgi:hypothetical protein
MSKEHTSLAMSGDEKHDPISGHAGFRPTSAGGNGAQGFAAPSHSLPSGGLPGGAAAKPDKKMHPAVIIALWISLSSSVIGERAREVSRCRTALTHASPLRARYSSLQQGELESAAEGLVLCMPWKLRAFSAAACPSWHLHECGL